jgi:hypothetical protein
VYGLVFSCAVLDCDGWMDECVYVSYVWMQVEHGGKSLRRVGVSEVRGWLMLASCLKFCFISHILGFVRNTEM